MIRDYRSLVIMRETLKKKKKNTYNVSEDLRWTVDVNVKLSTFQIQLTRKKIWLILNFETGLIKDKNHQSFYYLRFSTRRIWILQITTRYLELSLAMEGNITFCNLLGTISTFMHRPWVNCAGVGLPSYDWNCLWNWEKKNPTSKIFLNNFLEFCKYIFHHYFLPLVFIVELLYLWDSEGNYTEAKPPGFSHSSAEAIVKIFNSYIISSLESRTFWKERKLTM